MRLTVSFPNVGAAHDKIALRDYAQALEGLGVDTIHVVDHVVYAWPAADGTQRSQYRADMWHLECFVTLGFLAAVTDRVGLETGVVVLPQRPPALVAKEAATVDVLSNGRLRLGIGVGWQAPEYGALGVPFKQRGVAHDRGHRGAKGDVDGAAHHPQGPLLQLRRRGHGAETPAEALPAPDHGRPVAGGAGTRRQSSRTAGSPGRARLPPASTRAARLSFGPPAKPAASPKSPSSRAPSSRSRLTRPTTWRRFAATRTWARRTCSCGWERHATSRCGPCRASSNTSNACSGKYGRR